MILKNILLLSVLLFISYSQMIAQNQAPVVENVIFAQRTDSSFIVDIYYDVKEPDGDEMTVTMEVFNDNGIMWDFPENNIKGDIGSGITNGTNKNIVGKFGTEHAEKFNEQFRVKIIGDEGGGTMGEPCPGVAIVVYEGKTYNTVLIGNQCWLKENLDVGTMIQGSWATGIGNSKIEKYCYDDNPSNCETYGGLYTWSEAMQSVTNEGTQGICPPGWHIPTLTEFETLFDAVGGNGNGNALKAIGQGISGTASTNTSGFSALMAGYFYRYGPFNSLGGSTTFWSSTEYGRNIRYAHSFYLISNNTSISDYKRQKARGFSVRCLKD